MANSPIVLIAEQQKSNGVLRKVVMIVAVIQIAVMKIAIVMQK